MAKTKKVTRADGWQNFITWLGNAKVAKQLFTHHVTAGAMTDSELESLYFEDGLAYRIVSLLPDDMFREGWDYTFPKLDEIKAGELAEQYAAELEALGAAQKLREAFNWKRLYGGAAIFISALDGHLPEEPLDVKRIKSLEKLRVIDRTDINWTRMVWQDDPTKPRYGQPELYCVKFQAPNDTAEHELMVHHSRIIELHGDFLLRGVAAVVYQYRRQWVGAVR